MNAFGGGGGGGGGQGLGQYFLFYFILNFYAYSGGAPRHGFQSNEALVVFEIR